MPNILISYRRDDSDAIAGRIRDRLAGHFGDERVFMDIDSIPIGTDFRHHVQSALKQNDVVLAIIGPKWMGPMRGGVIRIQEEADPVRVEIETAFKNGIPVIPVLVGKATMPKSADLPESLRDLPFLNAAEVSAGRDFSQHIERLLRSIERFLDTRAPEPANSAGAQPSSVGRTAPPDVSPAPARPSAWRAFLARNGLLFDDEARESAFIDAFRERFYFVGQTSMMFGIVGWVVFGATDLLSGAAGLQSIQFRFMLAMPLMILFFGVSFTNLAKRHWQTFFAAFAFVGISCMYIALLLVGPEEWFRVEQGTMSFMLFLGFVGLAPFTTVYTVGVGLFIALLHTYYVASQPNLPAVHAFFYMLFVGGAYAVICTTAWLREKSLRAAFAGKLF